MHSPNQPPEQSFGKKVSEFVRSPQLMLMLVAGIVLVLGVPYLALQTLPGIRNALPEEASAPKGNPNLGIDFQELGNLPPELATGASDILSREEGELPASLADLPQASGFGLVYPVTETIESTRPTLSWAMWEPGPYKVELFDSANQVVSTGEHIPNLSFVINKELQRGATYTWRVTAANSQYESASFVVLSPENDAEWLRLRRSFGMSHLALGLIAEQMGMLTIAEREYQELAREFPQAEAPARLLANVQSLR